GNGFIWDDAQHVTQSPATRSAEGLYDIWFKPGSVPQYYPLSHTLFWAEYQWWQADSRPYHAVNLLLHAACVLLVWQLLKRLAVPGAWLAAAIFAVHPVEVETVAWVSEQKNLLSCALALAAILAYLRFSPATNDTPAGRGAWSWYAVAFVLYAAALAAKTVSVSVPAVLLVIYWWKRGRVGWREVARLAPFFALGLAMAAVTVWMERTFIGATGPDWELSWTQRLLIAGRAVWFYLGKLLWPEPLIFFYPRWTVDVDVWWQYLFPGLALGLVVGLWLARKWIGRGPLAAVLIFGGVLVPALGFFDVFPFRYSFVADHFQYHAGIALMALAAAGWAMAATRLPPEALWFGPTIAACVLVPLAIVAHDRTYAYENLTTLYEDTIAQNPSSWVSLNNLGIILQAAGKHREAVTQFRKALGLFPNDSKALYNCGISLAALGDLRRAAEMMQKILEIEPNSNMAQHELGIILYNQQHAEAAVAALRKAVEMAPAQAKWRVDLAVALIKANDPQSAERELRGVIADDPQNADAHNFLGILLAQRDDLDGAISEFKAVLKIDSRHPTALGSLQSTEDARQHKQPPAP
ncbi:MAG TPA: tetratricopeptide repeat protein, partial [Pirellulales bacterium]|nr:tetratricopeptide repeat protein [Pirellulales bacterium]